MTPKKKPPIGITLLALTLLWIGCCGTLIFPIMLLDGGMETAWRHIVGGMIHSELLLRGAYWLVVTTWFLFYVAYAVIGVGLWKLRNWARRAQLVIFEVFGTVSVLVAVLLVRPASLAFALLVGTAIPFAWFVWYLMRPRVRFAFGAWSSSTDPDSTAVPPPGLSKKGKSLVAAGIIATFALYIAALSFGIEDMTRSTGVYKIAVNQAHYSPCVASVLGIPATPDRGTSGSWEEDSKTGKADIEIPLHGPKDKGFLVVHAKKQDGVWNISSLVLLRGSDRFQLVPAPATGACKSF